jgi:hypothetical protein
LTLLVFFSNFFEGKIILVEVERLDFGLETEETLLIFLGRGLGQAQVQIGPCSEVTHVDLWLAEIK